MSRSFQYSQSASNHRGPVLIGLGLITVFAAQWVPAIPIAAAIAIIGLGATHTLTDLRQNEWLLGANLLVYVSLVVLAVGAQFHARLGPLTIIDTLLAITILAYTTTLLFTSRGR